MMIPTTMLWLMLATGQVVNIPGFDTPVSCEQVGAWYRDEAARGGKPIQYKCGPPPDLGPRPWNGVPTSPPRLIDR